MNTTLVSTYFSIVLSNHIMKFSEKILTFKSLNKPLMIRNIFLLVMLGGLFVCFYPSSAINRLKVSTVFAVFVASTPCTGLTRTLGNIPPENGCELIRWKLNLYQNTANNTPDRYHLTFTFGQYQNGTSGLVDSGTKLEFEGKWTITKGSKNDPNTVVYQLDVAKPQIQLSFQKIDNNLLHLLDNDRRLMIGNSGESFTFNRVKE